MCEKRRDLAFDHYLFLVVLGIMLQMAKTVAGEDMYGFCDLKHDVKGNGSCISRFICLFLASCCKWQKLWHEKVVVSAICNMMSSATKALLNPAFGMTSQGLQPDACERALDVAVC